MLRVSPRLNEEPSPPKGQEQKKENLVRLRKIRLESFTYNVKNFCLVAIRQSHTTYKVHRPANIVSSCLLNTFSLSTSIVASSMLFVLLPLFFCLNLWLHFNKFRIHFLSVDIWVYSKVSLIRGNRGL